jgi:hypothetical protein
MTDETSRPKHPGGRPTKYDKLYPKQAEKLCALGATDEDLANFFEVSIATINNWKVVHSEFLDALKNGREPADDRVERSLYQRAVGYSYDAVKIFMPASASEPVYAPYREHVPPDTTAAIFWLKNRRKGEWRDKHDIEVSHKSLDEVSDADLAAIALGRSADAVH